MKNRIVPYLSLFALAAITSVNTALAQLPPLLECNGNAPTFSVQCGGSTHYAYIDGITTTGGINNISNTGTGCGNTTNSYSDYTGTSMKVTQDAGKSVDVKISWVGDASAPAMITNTLTKIYVDWNRNGTFEANEYIAPASVVPTHPHAHSASGSITIDVPPSAKDGLTRMRIVSSANISHTYDPNSTPCNGAFGEAEDYVFEVINPCVPPNVVSIANVDYKSGDFSWTPKANAEFYEYIITPVDTIPHDTVVGFTFTTGSSVEVDTFECNKKYYVLVRTICDTANKIGAKDWNKSGWIRDSFTTQPCCNNPEPKHDMVTSTTARIYWPPVATSTGYEYSVSTLTTPPQKGVFTINTSVIVQGLSPRTTYYVHVRSRCNPTPLSEWTYTSFKTLGPTGVEELSDAAPLNMDVYPNPVGEVFTVKLNGAIGDNASITIQDLTGKVVHTQPVTADKTVIPADNLTQGIYIVKYSDNDHNLIMKVAK